MNQTEKEVVEWLRREAEDHQDVGYIALMDAADAIETGSYKDNPNDQ